jgi:glutamyl/glutaminyl-tRNA synthetase
LLRYLEAKLLLLNKRLKERKSSKESAPSISSQVIESDSSSEFEHEDSEEIDPANMSLSGSEEEEEEELDENGNEEEEEEEEDDDMEQFLDEVDFAEERRLTELENPSAKGQVCVHLFSCSDFFLVEP